MQWYGMRVLRYATGSAARKAAREAEKLEKKQVAEREALAKKAREAEDRPKGF